MCGRFVAVTPARVIAQRFRAVEVVRDAPAKWNVAPTDPAPVVVEDRDHRRVVDAYRWGLVPSWAEDDKEAARRINARAETLTERPVFRDSFTRHRCIIPVDGFYEWRRRDGERPEPFFIGSRDDGPLAFAGLWASWVPGRNGPPQLFELTGDPIRTCAIVTTAANATMSGLHDRMPAILPPDAWDEWLDAGSHDTDALQHLLVPAPDDAIALRPVGPAVNDVRNDGPHLVAAVACG